MAIATKPKVYCNTFSSLHVEVFSERDEELFVEVCHVRIEGRLHVCWNESREFLHLLYRLTPSLTVHINPSLTVHINPSLYTLTLSLTVYINPSLLYTLTPHLLYTSTPSLTVYINPSPNLCGLSWPSGFFWSNSSQI